MKWYLECYRGVTVQLKWLVMKSSLPPLSR